MLMCSKMMGGDAVTIPTDYILAYPFSGDLLDKSTNANNGIGSGIYSFVAGRKGTDTAISFNNGLVATTNNVTIGTDKNTQCFWFNTTQSTVGVFFELSTNYGLNSAFVALIGEPVVGVIQSADHQNIPILYNNWRTINNYRIGWHFCVITIDRSQITGTLSTNIYIDEIERPKSG